ncbi:MAG TPA: ABC transporter permease [Solirubrobacterales bacterium]|nr:ABC transporter permease [Solirubrobacterales bacterium]
MSAEPSISPLASPGQQTGAGGGALRRLGRRLRGVDAGRYAVYVGFLAILILFSITLSDEGFTSSRNLLNILEATAPITVMAVATVFVLGAGEIDLSIGAVVALASLVAALVMRETGAAVLGVAAGLGVGAGVGLLNGILVTRLRLPSFLVTLGTMGLVTGLAQRITNLESIPSVIEPFNDVFGSGELLGVSTLIVWTAVAVAIGHYVLRHSRTGAHVLASGDNADAAQVSGVRVGRVKTGVLVASGIAAAFAGLMYTANLHGATYTLGSSDLLTVIAAVVIGGTRLFGGRGTVIGALVGSLLLGIVDNGLILSGFSSSEQMIAQGAIILIAVALTLREPAR